MTPHTLLALLHFLFSTLLFFFLTQCASTSSVEMPYWERPVSSDGSIQFEFAMNFDKYLKGSHSDPDSLFAQCPNPNNVFCPTLARRRELERRKRVFFTRTLPGVPPPLLDTEIKMGGNNTVLNWKEVRRAKVKSLLNGLEKLQPQVISSIGRTALKEKQCPNSIALAAAASLENNLPDANMGRHIADLYAHGARCLKKTEPDREHFFTRAGLFYIWANDYAKAILSLKKAPSEDAYSGRSTYWLSRAYAARGEMGRANRTLALLNSKFRFSFHSLLTTIPNPAGTVHPRPPKEYPHLRVWLDQIETLYKYGFEQASSFLADWMLDRYSKLSPESRLYVLSQTSPHYQVSKAPALFIHHPRLVSRESLKILYPRAYAPLFDRHHGDQDPLLMLAISRKESQFDSQAISPATAQGLMQIHPKTGEKYGGRANLLDPENNVRISAKYLGFLSEHLAQRIPLMVAAYNAGEEPVNEWLKRYPTHDPVLFIDLIPFRETRDYVGFVLSNYYWYQRLYREDKVLALSDILGTDLAVR